MTIRVKAIEQNFAVMLLGKQSFTNTSLLALTFVTYEFCSVVAKLNKYYSRFPPSCVIKSREQHPGS